MTIKILLSDLKANSSKRPLGYYQEVISKGTVEIVILDETVYRELTQKYARPPGQSVLPQPIPRKDWPLWAKALAQFAKPEDKGIGDVVRRMIGEENSEAFKKWFKATTGKDCGCQGRQRRWNLEYPL